MQQLRKSLTITSSTDEVFSKANENESSSQYKKYEEPNVAWNTQQKIREYDLWWENGSMYNVLLRKTRYVGILGRVATFEALNKYTHTNTHTQSDASFYDGILSIIPE